MSYMKAKGKLRKAIGFVLWKRRSFIFRRGYRIYKIKPTVVVLIGLVVMLITPILVQAQQAIFKPPESPAPAEWDSPAFTASRDTRIEWVAFALPNAGDPQFSFLVIDDQGTTIDQRSGLEGMGFIEQEIRVNLHVTCKQLYTWEIRLFYLKAPPFTGETTTPLITTSEAPPVTGEAPKTVTQVVTIAVYTELPPNRVLVYFNYGIFGVAGVLLGVSVAILLYIRRIIKGQIEIFIARKGKPEGEAE